MVDPATAIQTVKTVTVVIKTAAELGLFEKIKDTFKPRHTVLVLGASGVGKTNLISAIHTANPGAIAYSDRTEFKSDPAAIKVNDAYFIIEDTPGHDKGGKDPHPLRIRSNRSRKKETLAGVINVVSYGYHETRYLKKPAFSAGQPAVDFLTDGRNLEIERLGEWASHLGQQNTTEWILTVVNKADCWWSHRADVLDHYEKGPYAAALKTDKSVEHAVLCFACEQRRFWDEGHVDPQFDDRVRGQLRKEFTENLAVLSRRKGQ